MPDGIRDLLESRPIGELVEDCLERISQNESALTCLLAQDSEAARARVEELRDLPQQERANMPLCGVPVVIKDNICIKGSRTTCGSRMLEDYVSPYSATVWEKLHQAGAVLIGKANMDEFAMGSSTENSAFGVTRNPWAQDRVPGGSSGGSAAAVAAGYCPFALGSDTGGSIRQPAAFCGVTGLKPTYGRVSRYGLVAFASSLDQIGPLTRSATDAALILSVIGGYDPKDSTSSERPLEPELADLEAVPELSRQVLAVPKAVTEVLPPELAEAFQATVEEFRALGHQIQEVDLPYLKEALSAYYVIAPAEASSNLARYDGLRYGFKPQGGGFDNTAELTAAARTQGFGSEVKRRIMLGTYTLSAGYYDAYYHRAQKVRTALRQAYESVLGECLAVLTPTAPGPAFRLGEKANDPVAMYLSDIFTVSANLTGLPALSLPCGFREGLPLGVQLMGAAFSEMDLLLLGRDFQRATEYHQNSALQDRVAR